MEETRVEPSSMDVSYAEVYHPAITEAKAEEEIRELKNCVPNSSFEVEKIWDL